MSGTTHARPPVTRSSALRRDGDDEYLGFQVNVDHGEVELLWKDPPSTGEVRRAQIGKLRGKAHGPLDGLVETLAETAAYCRIEGDLMYKLGAGLFVEADRLHL